MPIEWSRVWNLTLVVLQVMLAVTFAFFGATKFNPHQQYWTQVFAQIGIGQWFRYLVGGLEIACAVLLLVPRASAWAAAVLACTMAGATFVHLMLIGDGYAAFFPAFPMFLLVLIARKRFRALAHS